MSANNDYKLSRNVYSGDDIRAVARASRVDGIQNISLSQVAGDQYARTSGLLRAIGPGWVVNRQPRHLFRSARKRHFPWELSITGDNYITVRPGTLNGLLPVNMFDRLGPISGSGTAYVVLRVFTDGVQPSSAALQLEFDPPEPPPHLINLAPFTFPILIGLTVDLKPFNMVDGLLSAEPFVALKTTVSNPTPGTSIYDSHWVWNITQY